MPRRSTTLTTTAASTARQIKLTQFDYGYRVPEALTKYKLFKRLGCVAVLGWGTGDTEALSPTVTKDKIPYVSASYSGHLADPSKTPYNLFAATDYSTNARATLTAWFDQRWSKNPENGKRKPRLACAYMFASPYASAPIKAIKDQATLLGFEIGPDQDVSLFAIDTKSQVLGLKDFKPDVVWHGNTVMSVAATVRDAYSLQLGADHIVNLWAFDENLPKLAGKAAEGVMAACRLRILRRKSADDADRCWNTERSTIPACQLKSARSTRSKPGPTPWPWRKP